MYIGLGDGTGNGGARLRCNRQKTKTVIAKIDLNKASEKELAEVPRVGIKTARAIVDHGKAINGYKSMEQLQLVRGVGEKAYRCLLKYVVIGSE